MSKIDIQTTQNVTIEYELAPLMERIFAFLIDSVILWGSLIIFWQIFIPNEPFLVSSHPFNLLVQIPIFLFYSLGSEVLMDGQSLGKRIFGIKVVKITGEAASFNDYIIRWSFRMIDIYLSFGTLASLMIGSSPKHQRLGDLVGDTAVIKVRSSFHLKLQDILKINSLENYEITYPDVRQFSEQEMLFIKNTMNRYNRYPNEAHRKALMELTYKITRLLKLEAPPKDKPLFLKTLIRDYIVLTR